jgi:lipoprotein-anchoring transpeptidase ErfK/SrfK
MIATMNVPSVAARVSPDPNARVIHTFADRDVLGSPQVFDLLSEVRGTGGSRWYKALLPIRPNGSTGYIPGKSLSVGSTTYRLAIDRSKFTLRLFDGCRRVKTFKVGIGTGSTPTPVGRFYLTGLYRPPDPTTIYGVYVYTLSGFSEVLTNWRLGGIVGLHGTNDPSSIGRQSSHGCIRMNNSDILQLERILPLGTPVVIR